MSTIDPAKVWSLNYRLVMSVITTVAPKIAALGLETKALFVLGEVEAHPYPAELAAVLGMPKPTVTVYVKHLEAAGFLRREIDAADLRRHRLVITPTGHKAMSRGLALLSDGFSRGSDASARPSGRRCSACSRNWPDSLSRRHGAPSAPAKRCNSFLLPGSLLSIWPALRPKLRTHLILISHALSPPRCLRPPARGCRLPLRRSWTSRCSAEPDARPGAAPPCNTLRRAGRCPERSTPPVAATRHGDGPRTGSQRGSRGA
jgi:DNA-binding MarR family transcriptional regulator